MEQEESKKSKDDLATTESGANKNFICFFCKKEMKFDRVVGKRSIEVFHYASKQKKDKDFEAEFEKLLEDDDCQISCHELCHIKYKKLPAKKRHSSKKPLPTKKQMLEKTNEGFVYDKMCLFCCEDASDEFIKRQKKNKNKNKKLVSKVSDNGTLQENILNFKTESELYQNLRERFDRSVDLFKMKARYHRNCYKTIAKDRFFETEGPNFKKKQYMQKVVDHILSNPDKNFYGINEFIEFREDLKNDPDNRPLNRTMRTNLITELGDDYKVLNVAGYGLLVIRAEHVKGFDMEKWKIDQLKKLF